MRKNRSIIIFYIFTLGSLGITVSLFVEGRSYPGTGWAIVSGFFMFLIALERFLRGREDRMERPDQHYCESLRQQDKKSLEHPDAYTLIMTTKDCIKVQAVLDALRDMDIDCIVLDSHSAALMRFLPDVEMRVMVRGKDYERSAKIIANVISQNRFAE